MKYVIMCLMLILNFSVFADSKAELKAKVKAAKSDIKVFENRIISANVGAFGILGANKDQLDAIKRDVKARIKRVTSSYKVHWFKSRQEDLDNLEKRKLALMIEFLPDVNLSLSDYLAANDKYYAGSRYGERKSADSSSSRTSRDNRIRGR